MGNDRTTLVNAAELMSALGEHILEMVLPEGNGSFAVQRHEDACKSAEKLLSSQQSASVQSEIMADWPAAYRVTVTVERIAREEEPRHVTR